MTNAQYKLTVIAGDEAAEIFILDSQFRRIKSAVGKNAGFKLPPGLYTVKLKTGSVCQEKQIALKENKTVSFDPPVLEKNRSLQSINNVKRSVVGKGSRIVLYFSKDNININIASASHGNTQLTSGLKLHDRDDRVLIDFEALGRNDVNNANSESLVWKINVSPGELFLSLQTENGDVFKQTIVASPGWQLVIFLGPNNYGVKMVDLRADIRNASIQMMKLESRDDLDQTDFQNYADRPDFRLAELARQALRNGKNVLDKSVVNYLEHGKFENPMLGIYAVHLQLLDVKFDEIKLRKIVERLRRLVVDPHPDVEALALKLKLKSAYIFDLFPMLFNSWIYVVEESERRPVIIPEQSLSFRYAGKFWSSNPWLIWIFTTDENKGRESDNNLNVQVNRLLESSNMRNVKTKRQIHGTLNDAGSSYGSSAIPELGLPKAKVEEILKSSVRPGILYEKLTNFELKIPGVVIKDVPKNSNDPQKDKWGGSPEVNFRKMTAKVSPSDNAELFIVEISVETTNPDLPLSGSVIFHLHDTFLNDTPVINVLDGKAILKLKKVWGAFTVGAEADNKKTRLELDLSTLPDAPEKFKTR